MPLLTYSLLLGLCLAPLSARQAARTPWTVLAPIRLAAKGGVELNLQEDGSVLASGKNPATTVYEFEADLDLSEVTAVRLETLTDGSMVAGGPGRGSNGNFVLSEFQLFVSQRGALDNRREVVFKQAFADRSEPTLEVGYAVDGRITPDLGWSPHAHKEHAAREAVFIPARPFGFKSGSRLKFRLSFESKWEQHAIGRFRLSVTCAVDLDPLLPAQPTVSAEQIDQSTRRGIDWLLENQEPDGSWAGPDRNHYHGMTALGVYTLVQCGVKRDHPAVRAALAYMEGRPCYRTYDLGCNLMAYKALGEPYPSRRVAALTAMLLETQGNGSSAHGDGWGYPFGYSPGDTSNHIDLSNTQYALLGLRAAAGCGERIPSLVFERVAKDLLAGQGEYGSFQYQKGRKPTASMTVAGMTCLAVCAGQLEKYQGKQALIKRCMNGISLGEQWLRMNWSVEANLEQPRAANSGSNRWLYYYLYGLERVGSLLNTRFLGGHDWHGEAAAAIVKNQRTDGSWTTAWAEADANTCFALLFLQRGTQTTGREERPTAVDESVKEAAFEIKSNGDNPLVAWVGALNEAVRERLERGETASEAIWSVDGIEVARRPADPKQELTLQRFTLEQALGRNGRHELQAALRFVDAEGQPAGEELSRSLIVAIDSVEDRFHRTAILDASANLVDGAAIRVAASSSHSGGHSADRAVDGRAGTSWLCAANDSEPWIQLRPLRPIRAGTLKLTPGHPYPGSPVDWARPHKIEVSINRGRPLQFELPDGVSTKHTLPFDATGVRSLHIAIKSVHAGLRYPALAGFAEIELFPPDHPGPGSGDEESIWILPPPGEPAAIWRYTKTQPTGEWTRPEHDDSAWASGPAPFDNIGRDDHPRTVWDTQGIWLRRDLELSIAATRRLVFEARVDDSAEIWLNGVLAAEVKTYTAGRYITLQLEPEAVASLHPGRNSLAVKVVDFGGARCFDLLVVRR